MRKLRCFSLGVKNVTFKRMNASCWLSRQRAQKRTGTSRRPAEPSTWAQRSPERPRGQRERAQQVESSPSPNNSSICLIHQALTSTKAASTAKNKSETATPGNLFRDSMSPEKAAGGGGRNLGGASEAELGERTGRVSPDSRGSARRMGRLPWRASRNYSK